MHMRMWNMINLTNDCIKLFVTCHSWDFKGQRSHVQVRIYNYGIGCKNPMNFQVRKATCFAAPLFNVLVTVCKFQTCLWFRTFQWKDIEPVVLLIEAFKLSAFQIIPKLTIMQSRQYYVSEFTEINLMCVLVHFLYIRNFSSDITKNA